MSSRSTIMPPSTVNSGMGGRTNASIANKLYLSQRAVEKHSHAIFRKLGLGEDIDINQRVSAVLFFLEQAGD